MRSAPLDIAEAQTVGFVLIPAVDLGPHCPAVGCGRRGRKHARKRTGAANNAVDRRRPLH